MSVAQKMVLLRIEIMPEILCVKVKNNKVWNVTCLMVSIWVRTAFTTLIASDGSDDDAFLAAAKLSTSSMRTQTKAQGSSISSARELKLKKKRFSPALPIRLTLDMAEHLLNEFSRLGEPFGKKGVTVHLDKISVLEPVAQTD